MKSYKTLLASPLFLALILTGCAEKGDKGEVGPVGSPGSPGLIGPIGAPGLSLVTTSVAASTAQCVNGGQILLVAQDNLGIGEWAAQDRQLTALTVCNGIDGVPGTNATPVTIVPLCSGTPSYPSVFIESALCINNSLYGVYSANGGFGTVLLSGAYSSNAIGSSCNFVVSGCNVTQQ